MTIALSLLPSDRCQTCDVIISDLLFFLSILSPSSINFTLESLPLLRLRKEDQMTPADMAEIDTRAGDGQWLLSDPEATQIVPSEYYENRQGGLAGTVTVSRLCAYLKPLMNLSTLAGWPLSQETTTARQARKLTRYSTNSSRGKFCLSRTQTWKAPKMKPHSHSRNPTSIHAAWVGIILTYPTMMLLT